MERIFLRNKSIQNYIGVIFLLLSVLSFFITIIIFGKETHENPLVAELDLKVNTHSDGIVRHLSPDDNAIRIVARYEDTNAEMIPLKMQLIKGGSIVYSKVLESKSGSGYSKPDFKKGLFGREKGWYWDYGTFNIKSKGNYKIKIIPEKSLESLSVFDVFISKKNSESIVHIWGFITIVLLIIGAFFGRNIKITLK